MTFHVGRWFSYLSTGMVGGAEVTLGMWLVISGVSLVFALPIAAMRSSTIWPLRLLAMSYIEIFRSTPLLVQLLAVYAGLPILTGILLPPWPNAVLVITLNSGSYLAESYRAGVAAVPKGQREVAASLGMGPVREWTRVILPQAVRIVQPSIGTILVSTLLATPFVYLVGVVDLMAWAQKVATFTGDLSVYLLATCIYAALALSLTWLNSALERRLRVP